MILNRNNQCPLCGRSYIENKALFCRQFSLMLNEEERKKARFVFQWTIFHLTRECEWVYRGWRRNCAGFRRK